MTVTTANIDIGDLPNDGTGDPLRTAFEKINENFIELIGALPEGPEGSFQFNSNGNSLGTANFAYIEANNTILLGSNIVPISSVTIGTSANRVSNLYLGNASLKIGSISVVETGNILSFPISVLPTSKASFHINNLTTDGNANITNKLTVASTTSSDVQFVTTTNTANQSIFEIPASSFSIGTFKINSREASSNNSQSATIIGYKSNNGVGIRYVVSGTIFIGTQPALTNYNIDVAYGNVRFMVSPILNSTLTHSINYQVTA